jgi:Integrase core domain
VAKPKRPQTLGKIERFWGTLWRECVERSVFLDLEDARRRIGLFIDHYNFQRVHSGIGGLVPADRFFQAAPQVLATLKKRVAANALELARQGMPKKPFYLTGQVEGKPFSVHQAGDRVILQQAGQERSEIELISPPGESVSESGPSEPLPEPVCPQGIPVQYSALPEELPPGVSALDEYLEEREADETEGDA